MFNEGPKLLRPPLQLRVDQHNLERGGREFLDVLAQRAEKKVGTLGPHPGQVVEELLGGFNGPKLGADLIAGTEPNGGSSPCPHLQEVVGLPSMNCRHDQVPVLVFNGSTVFGEELIGPLGRDVGVEKVFRLGHCRISLMRVWTVWGLRECRDSHP